MGEFITNLLNNAIPIELYLAVSTVVFFVGVYGFLSRKNMIMVLISIELMLNAADINFAVFNRYLYPHQLEGFYFTLFAIAIAAAEAAIAIAIIINIYRKVNSIYIDENVSSMKH
ncbi:MAG: NADH-quinone oxidoreductase subunit K [Bacteroidales bacterium 45-6]|nr:MAG: NADH-quinone oxidoreductase subunit K [Bacteroidales bacterium 45-6]